MSLLPPEILQILHIQWSDEADNQTEETFSLTLPITYELLTKSEMEFQDLKMMWEHAAHDTRRRQPSGLV